MKHHLNTLFVFTQDSYLAKDGASIAVRAEEKVKLRLPIHNLGGVVCFGRVGISPRCMAMCAEQGVAVSFCTENGRFLARVSGFTPGNVLLRREQYRWADDAIRAAQVARGFILGKLANSRTVLLRAAREVQAGADSSNSLSATAEYLSHAIQAVRNPTQELNTEKLRGIEGDAAAAYFGAFNTLLKSADPAFRFAGRTRRPPMDRINSLLSFLYAMLAHDARAACESSGLDPAVGFLHVDRPGRPSLALDLVEEFRAFLADRLAVSMINLGQVSPEGFVVTESGAVEMTESTRKVVVTAYQRRKQEVIVHPFLGEKTTVGLLVHLQARLLSRFIRGELDAYPPLIWK